MKKVSPSIVMSPIIIIIDIVSSYGGVTKEVFIRCLCVYVCVCAYNVLVCNFASFRDRTFSRYKMYVSRCSNFLKNISKDGVQDGSSIHILIYKIVSFRDRTFFQDRKCIKFFAPTL